MNEVPAPRFARALLRFFIKGRYSESLEGDLLEETAAGRPALWYWQQVGAALVDHTRFVIRQQFATFLAATLFFLVALWVIAPATYPVMGWARTLAPMRMMVLLGWLAGVPLILGGVAGAAERKRHIGAILLGATIAYLSPATRPFTSAVCDLCAKPVGAAIPDTILLLTPFGSALLAGLGAWMVSRFHFAANHKESP